MLIKKMAVAAVLLLSLSSLVMSEPITLVEAGAEWNYTDLGFDLWPTMQYTDYQYSDFDWDNASWSVGNAAFGNIAGSTYWPANTDLALQKSFSFSGTLNDNLILNVASDNGFIIFINGTKVANINEEGYTSYWEYTLSVPSALIINGINTVSVFAEDHGGYTFFDMQLTGDYTPSSVPEPSILAFIGIGIAGLVAANKKKQYK